MSNSQWIRHSSSDQWYYNNLLHKDNGPAIIWDNGNKEWYTNGKRHKLDGPAVEKHSRREWWVEGNRHRVDGPAVEWANGEVEWYLYGFGYKSEAEWFNALIEDDQIAYLFKNKG